MSFVQRFYPKKDLKNVLQIDSLMLRENNIKAILLDIDNTLLDYNNQIIEGLEKWINDLKKEGIKFCILSNTNNKSKAQRMSDLLQIPYIFFATKPFKRGFKKAKEMLEIDKAENIAVVGDQVLTDVYGANRCNMYSILVEPIKNKDIFVTKFNRIVERKILKKYYEDKRKNEEV